MTFYRVFLNGIERHAIRAADYAEARREAKRREGATCDCIGPFTLGVTA